jgi:hypothetical protein
VKEGKEKRKEKRRTGKKSTSGYEKSLSRRSDPYTNLNREKKWRKEGPMSMRVFRAPRLAS